MLKINAIGNITSDFELRTYPNDDAPYAIMRLASTRRYRDHEGNRLTDFVSVKVRGTLAERCVEYLGKGSKIAVTGDLETQTMSDENGNMKLSNLLIKANDVEFLSAKKSEEEEKTEQNSI